MGQSVIYSMYPGRFWTKHSSPYITGISRLLWTRIVRSYSSVKNNSSRDLAMSTLVSKAPVLISGAGPSGLVLALCLRKNGIPVNIIDKELGPRLGERGAGVSPRSLELHKILGTFDDVYGDGKPVPLRREYDPLDNKKILKMTALTYNLEPTSGIPHSNPLFLGQNHHERILREHLENLGTVVEFGTELRGFTQSAQEVTAEVVHRTTDGREETRTLTASWLIGTDGARSVVRKTLGLDFMGETRDGVTMVTGDFRMEGEPLEFWEQWGDPKDKITMLRPSAQDSDIVNFLIAGKVDAEQVLSTPQATIDAFYNISGRDDVRIKEVVWSSLYRPNIRMVKQTRVGRVFIAGDAAHCHSPTGGQGLNSSIQDSINLGWKLALVEKGYAKDSLLDTYAEERLPVIAEMLNKTTELLNETLGKVASQPIHKNLREDMTQLGITYRGSSLILQEGREEQSIQNIGYNKESVTAALAGDRAPEAPNLVDSSGNISSIYGLLSPSCHSAFVFGSNYTDKDLDAISHVIDRQPTNTVNAYVVHRAEENASPSAAKKFQKDFVDSEGHAYSNYNITEPCVIIVRPDGVIGARVNHASAVEQYFRGVFTNL